MGRTKKPYYGNGKFSKGGTIHKTKAKAKEVAKSCEATGVAYRIRKLKKGYRVDKRF